MKDKVKQLAEQAGFVLWNDEDWKPESQVIDWSSVYDKELEKFAELIVRECGQVLVDNTPVVDLVEEWDKGYDRAMNDCIHHIYEHFGVEE